MSTRARSHRKPIVITTLLVTVCFAATAAQAQVDLAFDAYVRPAVDGQPDFGRPSHVAVSADGRHAYVATFPPSTALLTFEVLENDLLLVDTISSGDDGLFFNPSSIDVSSDGSLVVLASSLAPTVVHVFDRAPGTGLLSHRTSFDNDAFGVIDGIHADRSVIVHGRPPAPQSGGVLWFLESAADGQTLASSGGLPASASSPALRPGRLAQVPREIVTVDTEVRGDHEAVAGLFDDDTIEVSVVGGEPCTFDLADLEAELALDGLVVAPSATPSDLNILGLGSDGGEVIVNVIYDDGSIVGGTLDISDCRFLTLSFQAPAEPVQIGMFTPIGRTRLSLSAAETYPDLASGVVDVTVAVQDAPDEASREWLLWGVPPTPATLATFDRIVEMAVSQAFARIAEADLAELNFFEAQMDRVRARVVGVGADPPELVLATLDAPVADTGRRCVPDVDTACLNGFATSVEWTDFTNATGRGQVVSGGSADSGLFWFFGDNNWEVLAKVIDGCALNQHFWVFAAATTNVGYELTVTDPADPTRSRVYSNPLGTLADAITDTTAFPCNASQVTGARNAVRLTGQPRDRSAGAIWSDATAPRTGGDCTNTDTTLCLTPDRFRVEVDFRDFQGQPGNGRVVPLRSSDSGLFWFFDPANWEVLVKVLDGCAINGSFWVLSGATTNVEYTLTVTDTVTGQQYTSSNAAGTAAPAVVDVEAFPLSCAGSATAGRIR